MIVIIDGTVVGSVPSAVLVNGRLFAPLRSVVVRLADMAERMPDGRIVITRGAYRLTIRINSRAAYDGRLSTQLSAVPYQSGADVMIPLHDLTVALHERLAFDRARGLLTVLTFPNAELELHSSPAPFKVITPITVFTPVPIRTAPPHVVVPAVPRRTPIPVTIINPIPPL